MTPGRLDRLAWLSLFAFAAALGLQEIRTFDYWWHLRTGRLIAETGAVPGVDPFTYTAEGARWIDIHWLHQVGLYALYTLGGHEAVVVAKTLLVCAIVAVTASIGYRRERTVLSVLALALMLAVAADRFMPRPELPTFLCLAGVLALLERHERRPDAWVYAVVAIQVVWVNLHGLFALGLVLCAIYTASELLRPLLSPGASLRGPRLRRLAALTVLAALASLANPNGLDGALYPIRQLGMIGTAEQRGFFGSLIAELIPPLSSNSPLQTAGLAGLLAALAFAAMALNWRRLSGAHPLVLVAFGYLALGARRNLALLALVAAPLLVRNANEWLDARRARRADEARSAPRVRAAALLLTSLLLLGLVVDTATGHFFERIGSYRIAGLGPMEPFYPVGAAEWIARERPPGPIAHHMADGGYLIWRLYPDYRVMVDGRLEVFGEDLFAELMVPGPDAFRRLDERYRFGTVLVHYSLVASEELLWWLYLNSNWRMAFVDDSAVVFVRRAESDTASPDIDPDDPALFPPLEDRRGLADLMPRLARTNFYASLRRYDRALQVWEETLKRHPDLEQGPVVHAFLLERSGFGAAAEAILRDLLRQRPDDAKLHAQLGDLRLAANDPEAASRLFDAALALDPNLPYAMYRRAQLAERQGDVRGAVLLYLRLTARLERSHPLSVAARLRLAALGHEG